MNYKELLIKLSNTNESTEGESTAMETLLRKIGFPDARVVCGIAYLEGKGTIELPPMSIHGAARMVLKILEKENDRRNTC